MKKIFLLIITIGFLSCEQIEKLDAQMEPDSTDIANEIADIKTKMDAVEALSKEGKPVLLLKAFGTEPGWLMEIYPSFMKVLFNYGQDSLLISDDFNDAANEKGFEYSADNNTGKIIVKIKNESCTDDSKGDTHSRKVELTLQNKVYKGCGDVN